MIVPVVSPHPLGGRYASIISRTLNFLLRETDEAAVLARNSGAIIYYTSKVTAS